jgi:1-acyl-sn-glycerol-3-phosphate acyltransferase
MQRYVRVCVIARCKLFLCDYHKRLVDKKKVVFDFNGMLGGYNWLQQDISRSALPRRCYLRSGIWCVYRLGSFQTIRNLFGMKILKSLCIWTAGALFLIISFPPSFLIWLVVLPFDRKRVVMHRILLWHCVVYKSLVPMKSFSCEGKEKIVKGNTYIVISNHQSSLDIVFLNALGLDYKWISKIENNKVPIIGWYLSMADYISVDRNKADSKKQMFEKSSEFLNDGISIMIFPEGTRSPNGEIGFFKRGAFMLAIQTGVPLLPVVIDGTGGILPKQGLIFGAKRDIKMQVLAPQYPEDFDTNNPHELALKISAIMKTALIEMRAT